MYFVFVIDTSASMNQRTSEGLTLLDCAKSAVEHFIKIRSKEASKNDRYMLVSCADNLEAIKAGWTDTYPAFLHALKNLKAHDLSNIGDALKNAFDLLNMYRLQANRDRYGLGRELWTIDPAMMIVITDGGHMTSVQGVMDTLTLPRSRQPGVELTQEPFRWDQRVFTLALRMAGVGGKRTMAAFPEPATAVMSEVTGGRWQEAVSMKALLYAVQSLFPIVYGVVVNFEPLPTSTSPLSAEEIKGLRSRALVLVRTNKGFWPLPESYWPEPSLQQLPPRTAQPQLHFRTEETDPFVVDRFPFDKYEIQKCPLTEYLLSHPFGGCWQVFVANSSRKPGDVGQPFAYVKASVTQKTVNLFVFPYNYPKLWPLLDQLVKENMKPNPKWLQEFDGYVKSIPPYYIKPLREAFKKFGAPANLLPDHVPAMGHGVSGYLDALRQKSKAESDRISAAINQTREATPSTQSISPPTTPPSSPKRADSPAPPSFQDILSAKGAPAEATVDLTLDDVDGLDGFFKTADSSGPDKTQGVPYRNAFDVDPRKIFSHLSRMRKHFCSAAPPTTGPVDDEARFNVPIAQMGNYQEAMMRRPQLRPVIEDDERTKPLPFGNPFRNVKGLEIAGIDEADSMEAVARMGGQPPGQGGGRGRGIKRRAGSAPPGPEPPKKVGKSDAGASPNAARPAGGAPGGAPGRGRPERERATSETPPPMLQRAVASSSQPAKPQVARAARPSSAPSAPPAAAIPASAPVMAATLAVAAAAGPNTSATATYAVPTPAPSSSPAPAVATIATASPTLSGGDKQRAAAVPAAAAPRAAPGAAAPRPAGAKSGPAAHNEGIKNTITKMLRGTGALQVEHVLAELAKVQGDLKTRKAFVADILARAQRFNRTLILPRLQEYDKELK